MDPRVDRVTQPHGRILIPTLGDYYLSLERLTPSEQDSFRAGHLVVLYEGSPGTSRCSAYHPRDYVVGTLAAELELASFRPAADEARHDLYLFRRPAEAAEAARA